VLGEGALLVGIGVLVGVSPSDPLTLVAVALGRGLVTMVGCYVPARRVLMIDPAQALRQGEP
jgi:ABC-type lipoprotein release transport system permease subunit